MTIEAQALLNELLLKGYILHTSNCGKYMCIEGPPQNNSRPSHWYADGSGFTQLLGRIVERR